jgi:tubulin polyglutamylase TTLL6/13
METDIADQRAERVIINVSASQYEVVRAVATEVFQWIVSEEEEDEDCDVIWIDTGMTADRLSKMKPYQKISHFPGMYCLARKDYLGNALNSMRRQFPDDYDFYPKTWILPRDYQDFKNQFNSKGAKTFIVKPEASCQGRGIFLTRKLEEVPEKCVVQRYLHKPYLIDDLKFDLRIYVLVSGCDPLRIFLHKEGLTRFATEPYSSPLKRNLQDTYMHLTNYAVNKSNPKFIYNTSQNQDAVGHKWSLTALKDFLKRQGKDVDTLWSNIADLIIKTLCSAQPLLAHIYRSCQANDYTNSMCFEILGFDIILDHKLRPVLLEVNHSPSFTTDTPLDRSIKEQIITDSINLLDIKRSNRAKYYNIVKSQIQTRATMPYAEFMNHRKNIREKAAQERDAWEAAQKGGFTKIYPTEDAGKYDVYIEGAKSIWTQMNGRSLQRRKKPPEAPREDSAPTPTSYKQKKYKEIKSRVFDSYLYKPKKERLRIPIEHAEEYRNMTPLPKKLLIPTGQFLKPRTVEFLHLNNGSGTRRASLLQNVGRDLARGY